MSRSNRWYIMHDARVGPPAGRMKELKKELA